MGTYSYTAITETGITKTGVIEADSIDAANNTLAAQGYIPSKIIKKAPGSTGLGLSGLRESLYQVKPPDIILFTKQFRTLLKAGLSMLNILQVLEDQTENPKLRKVINNIHQDINEGASLHDAFMKYPKVFSFLYCSMIKAGEASGSLPEILDRLTYVIEHEYEVKTRIRSVLQYPIFVITFLLIAFIILFTFVIPKFVNFFKNAKLDLPLPTKISMNIYQFLSDYWYFILGIIVIAIMLLAFYLRTEQGRFVKDALLLRVPVIGSLLLRAAISRFASIFSILHSSGVDILDSMDILSGTIGNMAISRELDHIKNRLEEGRGIAEPLKSAKYFTPMLINMVAIGEETGNLQDMLGDVSEHYDTEVDYSIKKLTEAIGPVLIIGLAAIIGFFALAIFMPMWDLTKMVKF